LAIYEISFAPGNLDAINLRPILSGIFFSQSSCNLNSRERFPRSIIRGVLKTVFMNSSSQLDSPELDASNFLSGKRPYIISRHAMRLVAWVAHVFLEDRLLGRMSLKMMAKAMARHALERTLR